MNYINNDIKLILKDEIYYREYKKKKKKRKEKRKKEQQQEFMESMIGM